MSSPVSPSSPASPAPSAAQVRSTRLQLTLLVLIFAAPVALSYAWYFLVHPVAGGKNYGTLLDVHPLPEGTLLDEQGQPTSLSTLAGKWLLVSEDGGQCVEGCEAKLYAMRQVRAALGHDDTRVERVLLLDDAQPLSEALRTRYQGTHFLRLQGAPLDTAFTPENGRPHDHLWVVDPNGNLVMRYPANPDLKRLLKDMERLLKASQIG